MMKILFKPRKHFGLLAFVCCCVFALSTAAQAAPREFVAFEPAKEAAPPIVLAYDAASGAGFNYERLVKMPVHLLYREPGEPALRGAQYLQEAVRRMTGHELPIVSGQDMSRGVVLTTLALAPPEIRADAAIQKALADSGEDSYNDQEAFFIRTEPTRVLIVANTAKGLSHGVVELLESVGYEVLGMGPNWIHTPDYHAKKLAFNLERAGRPGFYIRLLVATSGQDRSVGTLNKVPDPSDEPVHESYLRWRVGTRQAGGSMPGFPGHALQGYHKAVITRMRETGTTEGFLVPKCTIGLDAERPASTPDNLGELWINSDADGQPGSGKVFISYGNEWKVQNLLYVQANLDLSVPLVREVILENLKKSTTAFFEKNPDDVLIFGTDPEDGGGYGVFAKLVRHPNWYPEYLAQKKIPFGRPYVLNGFKDLAQPNELWDATTPCDTVFAFNNWLLREYDSWVDSLPQAERVTATGKDKKQLVRASFYSYNYHDVPPNFNLDPRIRVMIASYPKHRGRGKWKKFASQKDMAQAFRVMLPREPSGDYWIISLSYYRDNTASGIEGSKAAPTIARGVRENYEAGFRAISMETDFNFGKQGLEYYLYTKILWNPRLTDAELNALRDRWLQRAFGSGWLKMKEYYDFMTPQQYTVNAPNNWAKAIRLIVAADEMIDGAKEPQAQARLDDLKQFWYFYYLLETGQGQANSRAMKEFTWKGQMSYITAMHAVTRRIFSTSNAFDSAGAEFNTGPAHYTPEETAAWWAKVLDTWKVTPVSSFAETKLANGKTGATVDINDLVPVAEFASPMPDPGFIYNSGYQKQASFLTVAKGEKETIGCKLIWGYKAGDRYYDERDVYYGVKLWNPAERAWEELVDKSMIFIPSRLVKGKDGGELQVAEIRYEAPRAGTYRFELGNGGNGARLMPLNYDAASGEYAGETQSLTYFDNLEGLTQSPVYLYIPKGVKSVDLEVWDTHGNKKLHLQSGLPTTGMKRTRTVDVSARGTHTVPLEPGEDGSLAILQTNGFAFPHLYSMPSLWAKSSGALLVPREIALADGLTIIH